MMLAFTSGKIEVKVNNVGAALVALRRAKLLGEARLEERVRRDSECFPIKPTLFDALVSLHQVLQFVGHNL
jgi:hypothetical protein